MVCIDGVTYRIILYALGVVALIGILAYLVLETDFFTPLPYEDEDNWEDEDAD